MAYQSYRDLEIYKKAHKLAIEIHEMSLKLPKFELYEEGSQIRRYKQEFIKFLTYSLGSCDETRDHLDTLYETKSLKDKTKYEYFCEEYDHLGKMISNFIKSVESDHKTRI